VVIAGGWRNGHVDIVADMSGDPAVSIIMSAWKPRTDWFHHAVVAALDQRDCSFELIVVDDGSPDPIASLLTEFADDRLRVLRVDHGGISHTRNAGIHAAHGEFFRFVDADDVLEPGSTARLLALAHDGNAISYGATVVCDDQLRPIGVKRSRLEGWIAEQCLLYRFDVKHMSMLFPRRVVAAVGDWDPIMRQCQDWDFVLRALEHAPVRGDQQVAAHYRRHGGSLSANLERALHYESLVVDRYFERHPDMVGTSLEREARAKLLMVRARSCSSLGNGRGEQVRLFARALALHPRRAAEEMSREAIRLARRGQSRAR
jgi:glycosyltransferase involved in cell wall biosynthesis